MIEGVPSARAGDLRSVWCGVGRPAHNRVHRNPLTPALSPRRGREFESGVSAFHPFSLSPVHSLRGIGRKRARAGIWRRHVAEGRAHFLGQPAEFVVRHFRVAGQMDDQRQKFLTHGGPLIGAIGRRGNDKQAVSPRGIVPGHQQAADQSVRIVVSHGKDPEAVNLGAAAGARNRAAKQRHQTLTTGSTARDRTAAEKGNSPMHERE